MLLALGRLPEAAADLDAALAANPHHAHYPYYKVPAQPLHALPLHALPLCAQLLRAMPLHARPCLLTAVGSRDT